VLNLDGTRVFYEIFFIAVCPVMKDLIRKFISIFFMVNNCCAGVFFVPGECLSKIARSLCCRILLHNPVRLIQNNLLHWLEYADFQHNSEYELLITAPLNSQDPLFMDDAHTFPLKRD